MTSRIPKPEEIICHFQSHETCLDSLSLNSNNRAIVRPKMILGGICVMIYNFYQNSTLRHLGSRKPGGNCLSFLIERSMSKFNLHESILIILLYKQKYNLL